MVLNYTIPDQAAEKLSDEIIAQASHDYEMALCGVQINAYTDTAITIKECERFFNSEWLMMLTDISGKCIMEMLRKEVLEYGGDWKAIKKAHNIY